MLNSLPITDPYELQARSRYYTVMSNVSRSQQ